MHTNIAVAALNEKDASNRLYGITGMIIDYFREDWLKVLPNDADDDTIESACIGMIYNNALIPDATDNDVKKLIADAVDCGLQVFYTDCHI